MVDEWVLLLVLVLVLMVAGFVAMDQFVVVDGANEWLWVEGRAKIERDGERENNI